MNMDEIAKIAYELYLQRGGQPGDPVNDWLTAERIYIERLNSSATGQDSVAKSFELRRDDLVVVETRVKSAKAAAPAKSKTAPKATAASETRVASKAATAQTNPRKTAAPVEPKSAPGTTKAKKSTKG